MKQYSEQLRILIRYVVAGILAYLVGAGFLSEDAADPMTVEAVTTAAIGVLTELWWYIDKRKRDAAAT